MGSRGQPETRGVGVDGIHPLFGTHMLVCCTLGGELLSIMDRSFFCYPKTNVVIIMAYLDYLGGVIHEKKNFNRRQNDR